jgi:hypothetical protein
LDVEKIHNGLLVRVETKKLALNGWVLKHLIDLLGVQSAASLLLSVLVTRLAGHPIHDVIKDIPLRVAVSSSTAFDARNHFAQGELRNYYELLLWLGLVAVLVLERCLHKVLHLERRMLGFFNVWRHLKTV